MSLYAACFGSGLVHIFAFVASATEMRNSFGADTGDCLLVLNTDP